MIIMIIPCITNEGMERRDWGTGRKLGYEILGEETRAHTRRESKCVRSLAGESVHGDTVSASRQCLGIQIHFLEPIARADDDDEKLLEFFQLFFFELIYLIYSVIYYYIKM